MSKHTFVYICIILLLCILAAGCSSSEPVSDMDGLSHYSSSNKSSSDAISEELNAVSSDHGAGLSSDMSGGFASPAKSDVSFDTTSVAPPDAPPDVPSVATTNASSDALSDALSGATSDASAVTAAPSPTALPAATPVIIKDSPDMNDTNDFSISEITDEIYSRIYGKSYPTDCTLDLGELCYLTVLHMGFDGQTHVGELIVNKKIASATLEIFEELYAIDYPIEKIRLIDEYNADDEASMEDNNSSAFNYRFIAETTVLSNHALGYAIDINTLYNPYVYTRKDGSVFLQPVNAGNYVDRNADCPYYIRKDDACYEIFTSHGFSWGGDWNTKKDYQHFEYNTAQAD